MKPQEMRMMSQEELSAKEKELMRELFNFRMQSHMGQLESPAKLRSVRKDIARIKTIITEKEKRS